MYTHPDDPIVAGLILQSRIPEYMGESDGSAWRRVAGVVGCGISDLDCMRRIPAETLKRAVGTANATTLHLFGAATGGNPIVDNLTHFSMRNISSEGRKGGLQKW